MPLQVEEKFMLKLLSFSYVCIFSFQWILINHHQKPWSHSFRHRQSQSWEIGSLDIENCREASRSSCTEEELDEEDVPDPAEESQDDPPEEDPVDAPEEAPEVNKEEKKGDEKYSSTKEERKGVTR